MSTLRKARVSKRRVNGAGRPGKNGRKGLGKGPGGGGDTTVVTTSEDGFPSRMGVKLCYADYKPFTPSTAVASQVWCANSMFDPDTTGTGGQPYNYDDFAIEYKRYRVRSCEIEAQVSCVATGGRGVTVALVPTNSSTAFTSVFDAMSAPHAQWAFLNGAGNACKKVFRMHWSTKQILGEDWGDRFESLVTTSPGDQWFYQFLAFSNDASTSLGVTATFKLVYHGEFFDRNILTLDTLRTFVADRDAKLMHTSESKGEQKEHSVPDGYELVAVPLKRSPPMVQVEAPSPGPGVGAVKGASRSLK